MKKLLMISAAVSLMSSAALAAGINYNSSKSNTGNVAFTGGNNSSINYNSSKSDTGNVAFTGGNNFSINSPKSDTGNVAFTGGNTLIHRQ